MTIQDQHKGLALAHGHFGIVSKVCLPLEFRISNYLKVCAPFSDVHFLISLLKLSYPSMSCALSIFTILLQWGVSDTKVNLNTTKPFLAFRTLIWFLSRVHSLVSSEGHFLTLSCHTVRLCASPARGLHHASKGQSVERTVSHTGAQEWVFSCHRKASYIVQG